MRPQGFARVMLTGMEAHPSVFLMEKVCTLANDFHFRVLNISGFTIMYIVYMLVVELFEGYI